MRSAALAALAAALATAASARNGQIQGPYLVNPCLNSTFKDAKFCDPTRGIDERPRAANAGGPCEPRGPLGLAIP